MRKHNENNFNFVMKSESGVTLVELLVSIALLSIIVTTFLSVFIQAARTNAMTDRVNEATFIAQEEMELLIYKADAGILSEHFLGNVSEVINPREDGLTIITTKEPKSNMYSLIVEVMEGEKSLAQMETWVPMDSKE